MAALFLTAANSDDPLTREAERVFATAERLCRADARRMWGQDLCGPIMVADSQSRRFIALAGGKRTTGTLPNTMPIANTAIEWQGVRHTMLSLPLPPEDLGVATIAMHESWHRVQDRIGVAIADPDQSHLDSEGGRTALRLELRALVVALEASDRQATLIAVRDALSARAWRHERFPGSAEREAALEAHEGMAEYTGRVLAGDADMLAHLTARLRRADGESAYMRSFAYFTGPAYGVLLDRLSPGWRMNWDRRTGPAALLQKATGLNVTASLQHARYGLATIRAEEQARAKTMQARRAELRASLIDGPVLIAPVAGVGVSYDPSGLTPLLPDGTVYTSLQAGAPWGMLEVTRDGMLSPDWAELRVSLKGASVTATGMTGNGWTLTLAPGWLLKPGTRPGDRTIVAGN